MKTTPVVLAGALLASVAAALGAAPTVATYDPAQLPTTRGTVAQFSLTGRGDIDGVILQDGTQAHLPPPLGPELAAAIRPGDTVVIRGLKAPSLPVIQALSITGERTGKQVTDNGFSAGAAPPMPSPGQWTRAQGEVRAPLYGPRGDVVGALLTDGTQVHVPPGAADRLDDAFKAGRTLVAEGYGVSGSFGRALDAERIGPTDAQLLNIETLTPSAPPRPFTGPDGAPPPPPFAPDGPPLPSAENR